MGVDHITVLFVGGHLDGRREFLLPGELVPERSYPMPWRRPIPPGPFDDITVESVSPYQKERYRLIVIPFRLEDVTLLQHFYAADEFSSALDVVERLFDRYPRGAKR